MESSPSFDALRCQFLIVSQGGQRREISVVSDQPHQNVTLREAGRVLGVGCQAYRRRAGAELLLGVELCNPSPMDHPGGNWDLGAEGCVEFDSLVLVMTPCEGTFLRLMTTLDAAETQSFDELSIRQHSSGGDHWQSSNHVDASGAVKLQKRGFTGTVDGVDVSGDRATPSIFATVGAQTFEITPYRFWQNFPSGISATKDEIRIELFPPGCPGGHELQGGEQKTFEIGIRLVDENHSVELDEGESLDDWVNPLPSEEVCEAISPTQIPYFSKRTEQSDAKYEALIDLAIEGDDSFFAKREIIDEYGWRHYGDIWGDHEAVYHRGDSPMISHYNNQYDCVFAFAVQYLRTGDRRWWELMTSMADHAWDIDTYHTDQDKLLYNGGLFWHTYHYADAHTSTHRSYPRQLRVSQQWDGGNELDDLGDTGKKLEKIYAIGGGPAAAHNYNTGWMVAYHLTGKERYKEAAINGADYVIRIDDGSQTPFKWLSRADTGHSTCSSEGYYGPGRASGNSTHALLTGHQVTGEQKYLDRAAKLMRRTVHPNQDLEALDLLNAELRWFYTMYLQALGRFVDYKDSLGQRDEDFEYGVASLMHYAHWMAEYERPTLSEPEKLQYPTETWAAQDMRKWHVLQHATLYEPDADKRKRLQEKADFFYHYVVDYLTESPTKSLCRPVVLMLNFGWQRQWFLDNPDVCKLNQPIQRDFGKPQVFVPQKQIAIKRFKMLVLGSGLLLALAVVALLSWLLFF